MHGEPLAGKEEEDNGQQTTDYGQTDLDDASYDYRSEDDILIS